MPYFGYEEPFQLKAPLFCGPEFVKHQLQLFLVSIIPKPFLSFCGYRDGLHGTCSGTEHSSSSTIAQ